MLEGQPWDRRVCGHIRGHGCVRANSKTNEDPCRPLIYDVCEGNNRSDHNKTLPPSWAGTRFCNGAWFPGTGLFSEERKRTTFAQRRGT